jgi:NADH:ubiquinone oxidoreductase subunit E
MQSHSNWRPSNPDSALLVERYGTDSEAVVEALRLIQTRQGGLTGAAIESVAAALNLPASRVYGVATFYSMLGVAATTSSDKTARVCDGPACWLKGAAKARRVLASGLGLGWRVERSSCLGLCDQAPAALLEERPVGGLPTYPELGEAAPANTDAGAYALPRPGEVRVMLARAGRVDPDSLDSALDHREYVALGFALTAPPECVLASNVGFLVLAIGGLTALGITGANRSTSYQVARTASIGNIFQRALQDINDANRRVTFTASVFGAVSWR